MISFQDLNEIFIVAEKNFQDFSKYIINKLSPDSGAYALFHHNTECIVRLRDVDRILKRLFDNRKEYTRSNLKLKDEMPKKWSSGKPFPDNVKKLISENDYCTQHMRIDFEALYIFGGLLLDQFSILAAYTTGIARPEKFSFNDLVEKVETGQSEELKIFWNKSAEDMIWLFYNLKRFRNRLIVHRNRPWQKGTEALAYGDEFCLYLPSPPGWLDDEKLDEEVHNLFGIYKELFSDADEQKFRNTKPDTLLATLFDHIGKIRDREDRNTVSGLFFKKGGASPSFQVVGNELLGFIKQGSEILIDLVKPDEHKINLGPPFKKSAEVQPERST